MAILDLKNKKFTFKFFLIVLLFPIKAHCASVELVKMAFLYNFSNFITWPESVFENEHSPFTICLNADQDLIALLESTLKGKAINNRSYAVKKVSDYNLLTDCQIFFISKERYDENSNIPENQALKILYVSDAEGFANFDGMIEIKQDDQRLKLLVNLQLVKESELRFRSSLLNLMVIVK